MLRLLTIPLGVLLLLAGAMTWSRRDVSVPADFAFINRGENKTLDPNRMSWMQDIRIGYALWEGLFTLDPQTLDPVPGAAGKVDVSDDRLVYTFHIRPDAKWTNGDPVLAKDFLFAWRRMLEQPADYTYLFFYIKGARAYHDAFKDDTDQDFRTVGVEEMGPRTLRVTLHQPVPYFLEICAFPPYFPQHEASMLPFRQVDEASGRVTYDRRFTRPPNLVGNGPYRLESWEFKGRLRMVANEHYWDRANVKSRVIDQVNAEGQIAFEMYEAGQVDWLSDVNPEIAASLRSAGRGDLRVFPGFGTYFYSFNCLPKLPDGRTNPFADKRVRQALTMAIDKRPVVEYVTRMGEPVSANYIPRGIFPGYPSPEGLPYDPEAARRLMAEAGYPGGRGFPSGVAVLFNSEAHHAEVAQIVRRQWLEQLGVNISLEGVEIKIFGERLHNQEYAVARASWIGDYEDASTFTDKYKSDSENNDAKWLNKTYDGLCDRAAAERDPQKRLALLAEAERLLLEEAPIIPVYTYVNVGLHRDGVYGLSKHPKNMVSFKAVGVSRDATARRGR